MIAIINILESPAMAIIPKTERIQRMRSTPAISLNGLGRTPIKVPITKRISIFQRVIGCPFMLNKVRSGTVKILI
jgi:hypothetical protein